MKLTTILNNRMLLLGSLFLSAVCLLGFSQVQAQSLSGRCGTHVTWTFSGDTLTVSGSGDMANYASAEATPWADIRSNIKTAVIEDGVTSIGRSAFYDCTELTSVFIPQSVTRFEAYAFTWCHSLTSIIIPENVNRIGNYAFTECNSLTSVTSLNRTPPALDGEVFMDTDISKIVLRVPVGTKRAYSGRAKWKDFGSIQEINSGSCGAHVIWTFSGDTLTISGRGDMANYASAGAIPWAVFRNNIKIAVIEDGVTLIGNYAFRECNKLTSVTSLNRTPPNLDGNVFMNTDLSKITLRVPVGTKQAYSGRAKWKDFGSIQEINSGKCGVHVIWTFSGDTLTISGSGEMANYNSAEKTPWFDFRSNIKTAVIEDGVTRIGNYAFSKCSSLTSVTSLNPTPPALDDNVFLDTDLSKITLRVLDVTKQAYSNDAKWKDFGSIEEFYLAGPNVTCSFSDDTLTVSGSGDMKNFESPGDIPWAHLVSFIKTAVIEEGVTNIGCGAFSSCSGLTSVSIPQSVTRFEAYAFAWCHSLTSVTSLNPTPPALDANAFLGTDLSKITLRVPIGTKQAYSAKWRGFGSIEEILSGKCGEDLTWNFSGDTLTISGKGEMTNFTAFDSVPWHSYCSYVKEVVFEKAGEDSLITSIGDYAFAACSGLTSVTIPNSVTSIGGSAFYDCTELTSVTIPNSVTSIGRFAFSACRSLTSVTIPENVIRIGDCAFSECSKLTSVTSLNPTPPALDDNVFLDTDLSKITLRVLDVTKQAYSDDAKWKDFGSIEEFYLAGPNVTCTFSGGTLTVSGSGDMKNFESPGDIPWAHLVSLIKTAVIEEGVTNIGGGAFSGCSGLTSVSIPQSVTRFEAYAFAWTGLTSVTIPENVTWIGNYAFNECRKLTSVTSLNPTPPNLDANVFLYTDLSKITLRVPVGTKQAYMEYEYTQPSSGADENYTGQRWRDFGNIKEIRPTQGSCGEHVTWIFSGDTLTVSGSGDMANYASAGEVPWADIRNDIKTAVIEDGVTSIGGSAFYDCTELTSVSIPNSVTSIGRFAFAGCRSLTSVTIPEHVTRIGDCAFSECSKLTFVTSLNPAPPALDGEVFMDTDLSKITLRVPPGTVQAYSKAAEWKDFKNIEELLLEGKCGEDLTWNFSGDTLTISGKGKMTNFTAFDNVPWHSYCSYVKEVVFEKAGEDSLITSIGDYAFAACSGLTSLTIPNSVTSIGRFAFAGCRSLTSVTNKSVNPQTITKDVFDRDQNGTINATLYVPSGCLEKYNTNNIWKNFKTIRLIVDSVRIKMTHPPVFYTGDTLRLTAKVFPLEATAETEWSSSNKNIVTVSDSGLVTAISGGNEAYIKVTTDNGQVDSCKITVTKSKKAILSNLTVSAGNLTPAFHPDSTNYTDTVEYNVSSIMLTVKTNVNASIDMIMGTDTFFKKLPLAIVPLAFGENTLPVRVRSEEDGSADTTYTVRVFRKPGTYSNFKWTITSDKELFIEYEADAPPVVEMQNYSNVAEVPWYLYRTDIKKVRFSKQISNIGNYAFAGCSKLDTIIIPDSVTSIGDHAFAGCSGLNSVTIPDNVTSIGKSAFEGCSNLTSIKFPPKVNTISKRVLMSCTALTSITIPDNVTSIGYSAFAACSSLTSVISRHPTPLLIEGNVFSDIELNKVTLYVSGESMLKYKAADIWKNFGTIAVFVDIQKNTSFHLNYNDTALLIATNKKVNWSSSNNSILTVTGDGLVTTFDISGTARIYIATENGNKTDSCLVTVMNDDATLNSLTVEPGELMPAFDPEVTAYTVVFSGNSAQEITIVAKTADSDATVVSGYDVEKKYPLNSINNVFIITVVAEDTTVKKNYRVDVLKLSATDIPHVGKDAARVYLHGQILHVDSPIAERINIYSIAGTLLYKLEKPAGKTSFVINLPKQTLIAKGSSGWREKFIRN